MTESCVDESQKKKGEVSVILPVLNEGRRINTVVQNLFVLGGPDLCDVIVVDGDPHGETLAAITDHRVIRIASPPSRAGQMNAGARKAQGRILLFLHADTILPLDGFKRIREAVQNGHVGGAFELRINSPRPALRFIARATSLRARITRVPFGDQAIFLSAPFFRFLNGYKEIPIMEDVELMRRIRKQNRSICLLFRPVLTSARRWETEGIFFCTLRNWWLRLLYLLGVPPCKLVALYKPHQREKWAGS